MQGVTTSVVGNCGLSMAPVSDAHRDEVRKYLKPFLDKEFDYGWEWSTLTEFFTRGPEFRDDPEHCAACRTGTLRIAVKGFEPSPATGAEMARMKELLWEELEQGAFGLSSGLIYPPGSYTTERELTELASALTPFGAVYATHIRNEGDRLIESVDEAIAIGEANRIPVEISHHKAAGRVN